MPDDQYVLFIPDKDCLEPDRSETGKKIVSPSKTGTNNRAIEQWANRTPYVVSATATAAQVVTNAVGRVDLKPVQTTIFDDMRSWDNTNAIFTSKVHALYDFYLRLDLSVSAPLGNYNLEITLATSVAGAAYTFPDLATKHVHGTGGSEDGDRRFQIGFLNVKLGVNDKAKFLVHLDSAAAVPPGVTVDVLVARLETRRVCSIPGSTQ